MRDCADATAIIIKQHDDDNSLLFQSFALLFAL